MCSLKAGNYFTSPKTIFHPLIWSSLCFGDWSQKELVCISDIIGAISGKEKGKRTLDESLSGAED